MRWRAEPKRPRLRWRLRACRTWMQRRIWICWRRRSLRRQGREQAVLFRLFCGVSSRVLARRFSGARAGKRVD